MNQRQDKDEIVINNDKDIEEARKYFRSKANFAQEIAILLDKYLPTYKYTKNKYIIIPFNLRQCNDNHFDTLTEAIMFVIKHCKLHFQPSDKNMVRRYLQFCRILDIRKCDYVIPRDLTNKEFESAYRNAIKELRAINEL